MEIYIITNLVNNKKYIGLTTRNSKKRFQEHLSFSKHSNNAIHRAIRKYGKLNFKLEVLENCSDIESLIKRECFWIKYYDSMNPIFGYNMINQEDSVKIINDEVKNKISNAQKNRFLKMSKEEKDKLYRYTSKSRQGIKRNKQTKYVGVSVAGIRYACETSYLGKRYRKLFISEREAAESYDKIVLYLYGEDAKLNFDKKRQLFLKEDLCFFIEWFLNDKQVQGRPAKKIYFYQELMDDAKINAKNEIKKHKIKNTVVPDLNFLYNGKINPNLLLKHGE